MVALFVLGLVILIGRRICVRRLTETPENEGFAIESLEKLRDVGTISDEEFSRLRKMTLNVSGMDAEKDESKSSTDTELDD